MNPAGCFFASIPEIFHLFLQYFPDCVGGRFLSDADILNHDLCECTEKGITGKDLDLRCQNHFRNCMIRFINDNMIDRNDDYQVKRDVFGRFCLFLEALIQSINAHLRDAGIILTGYLAGHALFDEAMLLNQSERIRPHVEKSLRNLNKEDQCARKLIDLFPAMKKPYMDIGRDDFDEAYLVFVLYERFGAYIVKTAGPAEKKRAIGLINEMYRSDDSYVRNLAHGAAVEIMATEQGFDFDEISPYCSPDVKKDILAFL